MQSSRNACVAFLASLLFASSAFAAQRTFVASYGNDANPCTLPQPCRSFTAALVPTSAGGEIVVLDSAGYGPVTIAKSLTIVAPSGVHAGISVAAGDGIIVNAAGIEVTLRGLAISGQGGGTGIRFLDGASLRIEHCEVSGMSGIGIRAQSSGVLRVEDTIVGDNGGTGVSVDGGDATLVRVQSERNSGRGASFGSATGTVQGGSFAHNGLHGISAHNAPTTTTRVAIDGAMVSHNAEDGVEVFSANDAGFVSATVSNSVISANGGSGISVFGTVNGGPARMHAIDNTIANNASEGISGGTNTGSTVFATATRNLIAENGTGGIRMSNAGTIGVADGNTVVRNQGFGLIEGAGSTLYTRGNNTVNGNTSGNTSGSPTALGGV